MPEWTHCPFCGQKLEAGAKTCPACGTATPSAVTGPSGEVVLSVQEGLEQLTSELREALAPNLQLLRQLAQGGMGTVFLARDPALKRDVVVKVLSPTLAHDEKARKRFEREAESAAAVSHPNVISIYQVGQLPRSGTSYFVMQYVDGATLADEFPEGVAAPEAQVKRIIGEVASALAAAHHRGLVHRDVKPSNIMLDRESGRAMVLDFGISAAISPERISGDTKLTAQGASIGTPQYMSPEQAAAEEVTDRSDVYSLGIVAYELLSGRGPFEESNPMALIAAHINKAPPPVATLRADCDPQLASLVDRALAKEPGKRPRAEEFARALVPPAQPTVEWPPPGLERVHGLGARFIRITAITLGCFVAVLLLLALPPTVTTARWVSGESSRIWLLIETLLEVASLGQTRANVAALWLALQLVFTISGLALVLAMLARGSRVRLYLTRARRLGYPWRVVLDAATDTSERTGILLNRSGVFASLSEDEAARLLRLRRWRVASMAGGLLLGFLGALAWLLGVTGGWAGTEGAILPLGEALLTFLPMVLAFAGVIAFAVPEHAYVRRMRRSGYSRRRLAVRAEVVAAWLDTVRRPVPSPAGRFSSWLVSWVPGGMAVVLAAVVGMVLLFYALMISLSGGATAFARDQARSWLRAYRSESLVEIPWPVLDSLVASAGLRPRREAGEPDVAALRLLVLLPLSGARGDGIHEAWDIDTVGWDALAEAYRQEPLRGGSAPWELVSSGLTDSVRERLVADTTDPRLVLWRRIAAAGSPPTLWPFKAGLPGFDPLRLFTPVDRSELGRYEGSVRQFARRNLGAAVLHLADGRADLAERRAREVIVIGHDFLRQPLQAFAMRGAELVRWGGTALDWIGRTTDNATLTGEGRRLAALMESDQRGGWGGFWAPDRSSFNMNWSRVGLLLMMHPVDPPGLPAIGDRSLAPFVRWELIRSAYAAYCANFREQRFGIDPRRGRLLDSAAVLAADLPRTDEWVALLRSAIETTAQSSRWVNAGCLGV